MENGLEDQDAQILVLKAANSIPKKLLKRYNYTNKYRNCNIYATFKGRNMACCAQH